MISLLFPVQPATRAYAGSRRASLMWKFAHKGNMSADNNKFVFYYIAPSRTRTTIDDDGRRLCHEMKATAEPQSNGEHNPESVVVEVVVAGVVLLLFSHPHVGHSCPSSTPPQIGRRTTHDLTPKGYDSTHVLVICGVWYYEWLVHSHFSRPPQFPVRRPLTRSATFQQQVLLTFNAVSQIFVPRIPPVHHHHQ